MDEVVVGAFDRFEDAQQVLRDLMDDGFHRDAITVAGADPPSERADLQAGQPEGPLPYYVEDSRRGGAVVAIRVAEEERKERAKALLEYRGAAEVRMEPAGWRAPAIPGRRSDAARKPDATASDETSEERDAA